MGGGVALLLAFLLLAAWLVPVVLKSDIMYALFHTWEVERRYGFRHDSPYEGAAGCMVEVVQIDAVRPGGALDAVGIRSGEIVRGQSHCGFIRLLGELPPGETVELTLRTPLNGACVSEWPERTALVVAP